MLQSRIGGGPDCRHFVLMRMLDVYRQVNDSNDSLTRRLSAGGAANPGLLVHFDGLPLMSGNDTAYRDVASAPLAPLLRPAVICSCMDIIKLPGGWNDGVVVDAYAFAKQSDSPPPLRVIAGLAQLAAADGMLTHRGPMVGPHLTALTLRILSELEERTSLSSTCFLVSRERLLQPEPFLAHIGYPRRTRYQRTSPAVETYHELHQNSLGLSTSDSGQGNPAPGPEGSPGAVGLRATQSDLIGLRQPARLVGASEGRGAQGRVPARVQVHA